MMDLPATLIKRLHEMGIKDPTPIQKQAIPHALNGRDVMGLAQTGTGKTAAFGVPLVAQMLEMEGRIGPKGVRALVLAPTRELAQQIMANLKGFCEGTHLKAQMVVGGLSINPQISRLAKGVDVLVATPGRLLDLLDRRAVRLDETRFLVLDEADQMLDMGFIDDAVFGHHAQADERDRQQLSQQPDPHRSVPPRQSGGQGHTRSAFHRQGGKDQSVD